MTGAARNSLTCVELTGQARGRKNFVIIVFVIVVLNFDVADANATTAAEEKRGHLARSTNGHPHYCHTFQLAMAAL
jgi:hypothetical protein